MVSGPQATAAVVIKKERHGLTCARPAQVFLSPWERSPAVTDCLRSPEYHNLSVSSFPIRSAQPKIKVFLICVWPSEYSQDGELRENVADLEGPGDTTAGDFKRAAGNIHPSKGFSRIGASNNLFNRLKKVVFAPLGPMIADLSLGTKLKLKSLTA
jgi:hypothetical protein